MPAARPVAAAPAATKDKKKPRLRSSKSSTSLRAPKSTPLNALPVFPVDAGTSQDSEQAPQIVALDLDGAADELEKPAGARAAAGLAPTPIKDRLRAVIGTRISKRDAKAAQPGRQSQSEKLVGPDTRYSSSSQNGQVQFQGTWEEYCEAYRSGKFNVEDPPLPPPSAGNPLDLTRNPAPTGVSPHAHFSDAVTKNLPSVDEGVSPLDAQYFVAPKQKDEKDRQRIVNWLESFSRGLRKEHEEPRTATRARDGSDRWGKGGKEKKSVPMSSVVENGPQVSDLDRELADFSFVGQSGKTAPRAMPAPPPPAANVQQNVRPRPGAAKTSTALKGITSASLEDYAPFRELVTEMRNEFNAQISLVSVFDEDKQVFLAETGIDGIADDCPRDATICAHTILNDDRPFVVLDTHKDWRFRNNPAVQGFGSRFYAGISIKAPSVIGDQFGPKSTFGTLCIADRTPRRNFNEAQRAIFASFADRASAELENWLRLQSRAKLGRMEQNYREWRKAAEKRSAMRGARGSQLGIGFLGAHKTSRVRGREGLESVTEVATPILDSPNSPSWISPSPQLGPVVPSGAPAFGSPARSITLLTGGMTPPRSLDRPLVGPSEVGVPSPIVESESEPEAEPEDDLNDSYQPPLDEATGIPADDDEGYDGHEEEPTEEMLANLQKRRTSNASHISHASSSASTSLTNVFGMATRMVGETLGMSFAYLLAMDIILTGDETYPTDERRDSGHSSSTRSSHHNHLSGPPSPTLSDSAFSHETGTVESHEGSTCSIGYRVHSMRLLSSWGLPVAALPSFDPSVHLMALRCAEKALVYQNEIGSEPTPAEDTKGKKTKAVADIVDVTGTRKGSETPVAEVGALFGAEAPTPSSNTADTSTSSEDESAPPPAGGILVPVCELPPGPGEEYGKGYVLCAFTDDTRRVFGVEDVVYIQAFAESLVEFVSQE